MQFASNGLITIIEGKNFPFHRATVPNIAANCNWSKSRLNCTWLTRPLSIQSDGNSKARAETQFNRLAIPRFHCGLAPRLFDELALLPKLRKSLSGFPFGRLAISAAMFNLFLLITIRMNTGRPLFSARSCFSPWNSPTTLQWVRKDDARPPVRIIRGSCEGKKIENRYRLAKKW